MQKIFRKMAQHFFTNVRISIDNLRTLCHTKNVRYRKTGDRTMNRVQLNTTAQTLLKLYERKVQLANEIAEYEERLKQHLSDNNLTYLALEVANVSWVDVESQVLDTKRVKDFLTPNELAELSRVRYSKRFNCKAA